jgi:glycosyltransferase involved in cell wall biosynthesis
VNLHLFINALAASAGGGVTYVRNVVPKLAARTDLRATVALSPRLQDQIQESQNVRLLRMEPPNDVVRRFLFEQNRLPKLIRDNQADVLLSAGNFALWNSPVPQILLSRNSLYTSKVFAKDLKSRGHYGLLLDTKFKGWLASASIRCADVTVAPSEAFAQELRDWRGDRVAARIVAIHHGFDVDTFAGDRESLAPELASRLARSADTLRLLFVSHYNYYRNFETLFRALRVICESLPDHRVELMLTCTLEAPEHSGSYRANTAVALAEELGIRSNIVELGTVPYGQLHHVYRSSDIYVTPAYAETFAHPLVEAMASGLPVVASDLAVHREICGDAALYFPHSSPAGLAQEVARIASNTSLRRAISDKGATRAEQFSWNRHVDELLILAHSLVERDSRSSQKE